MSSGAPHRGFFAAELSEPVHERTFAIEDAEIIIDRVHLFIIHDRDTDVSAVQPARRKRVRCKGAIGKLHRRRGIDLGSIEVDLMLPHLGIQPGEVGAQYIGVEHAHGTRRLRVFCGLTGELNVESQVRAEEMSHEVEARGPQIER